MAAVHQVTKILACHIPQNDDRFLNFSLKKGNDLISAKPAFNFKGLKPEIGGVYARIDIRGIKQVLKYF